MKTFRTYVSVLVLIALAVVPVACDSNDDSEDASLDAVTSMIENTFSVFGNVAVDIILNGAGKSQPIYQCDSSGQVEYSSTSSANVYNLMFDDCNGISGDVDFGLSTLISATAVDLELSIDGQLTEECVITFSQFREDAIVSLEDDSQEIRLSGTIGATCNGENVSCTFQDDLLVDGDESSLIANRCTMM